MSLESSRRKRSIARLSIALVAVLLLVDFSADSELLGLEGEVEAFAFLALLCGLTGAVLATGAERVRRPLASFLLLLAMAFFGTAGLQSVRGEMLGVLPDPGYPAPSPKSMVEGILIMWWPLYGLCFTLVGYVLLHRSSRLSIDGVGKVLVFTWAFLATMTFRGSFDVWDPPVLWYHGLLESLSTSVLALAVLVTLLVGLRLALRAGWPTSRELCWTVVPVATVLLDHFLSLWTAFPFVAQQLLSETP